MFGESEGRAERSGRRVGLGSERVIRSWAAAYIYPLVLSYNMSCMVSRKVDYLTFLESSANHNFIVVYLDRTGSDTMSVRVRLSLKSTESQMRL